MNYQIKLRKNFFNSLAFIEEKQLENPKDNKFNEFLEGSVKAFKKNTEKFCKEHPQLCPDFLFDKEDRISIKNRETQMFHRPVMKMI